MSNRIKNYLGVVSIIAIIIAAFSIWSFFDSYSKSIQPSSFRSFTASGEGKIVAIPDVAEFTFSVITQGDKNIAKSQKENTDKVNKAIEFVKSSDVEAKDIKTQSYNLKPRYQYYSCPKDGGPCPPADIVGYTVTQTIEVKIRDFDKIGDILSGVIQNGANSVSELSFTIDDPTSIQNQARAEAIAKAKIKAESIAKAGGFRLGRLLSIEEGSTTPVSYYLRTMEAEAVGGGEMPAPTIEPGSQEVTIDVTLKYEIE